MSDTPDELQGLSEEELRFWRLIEERKPQSDGTEEMTLACGHKITAVIPLPGTRQYEYCPQCVQEWIDSLKEWERMRASLEAFAG